MQNEDRQYVVLSAKYEFKSCQLPLRPTRDVWREIIHIFLMEQKIELRVEQTGLYKRRVIRARLRLAGSILMDKYRHL